MSECYVVDFDAAIFDGLSAVSPVGNRRTARQYAGHFLGVTHDTVVCSHYAVHVP